MIHCTCPRWILTALVALTALALAGCGGAPPATAWPGLTPGDGVVFLTATTKAFAINSADGTKKWEYEHRIPQGGLFGSSMASDLLHAPPALGDNVVYFGSDGGYLLALDATTGVAKCDFLPEQPATFIPFIKEKPAPVYGGPVIAGKRVILAGATQIYAVDAKTCQQVWQFATDSRVWATPVVVGNTVYISTLAHKLIALDAETGKPLWTFDKPKGALAGNPVFDNGVVYVGSFDNRLYAVDAASGQERWSFDANNWVWDGPAVVSSTLYWGDLGGNVYALDAATQKLVWGQPFQAGSAVRATPLYTDGVLYVGTDGGALYALDAANGTPRWQQPFKVPNARFLTTPVMQSGLLLVAPVGTPTQLYGLDPSNGQAKWQFPLPTSQ